MNLNLPVVGPNGTLGPQWASDLNTAITLIDQHDHTSGAGKQITPAGMNINQVLSLNTNQLSDIASLALANLASLPVQASLIYEYGGELYFNDASGNQVQLTSGGTINAASIGGITGLGGTTGSVTYSSLAKNFLFESAPGETASIAGGPVSIYTNAAGSYYAKIQQNPAQAGNLDWSLPPSYPLSTLPMKSSASGALSISQIVTADIQDAQVTAAKLATDSIETAKIVDLNVTTGKLAAQAVTSGKIANDTIVNANINSAAAIAYSKLSLSNSIVNADISSSALISRSKLNYPTLFGGQSGLNGSTFSTAWTTIFTSSITVPTPAYRFFMNFKSAYGSSTVARWQYYVASGGNYDIEFRVVQNGTVLYYTSLGGDLNSGDYRYYPASIFNTILYTNWVGSPYTFTIEAKASSSFGVFTWQNMTLELIQA
jgi:hypothetical protein